MHEKQSPSRKSAADDARSLSRKRSSAAGLGEEDYAKWLDDVNDPANNKYSNKFKQHTMHKSGSRAGESEVSPHTKSPNTNSRSPARRRNTMHPSSRSPLTSLSQKRTPAKEREVEKPKPSPRKSYTAKPNDRQRSPVEERRHEENQSKV